MKITFEVRQGIIHLNSIFVLRATKNVVAIDVDCKQKYSAFVQYTAGLHQLCFGITDETLKVENSNSELTLLTVSGFPKEWYKKSNNGKNNNFDRVRLLHMGGRYNHTFAWIYSVNRDWLRSGYWDDDSIE